MKKIILATIVASLMTTSAMAFLGKVERIILKSDGTTKIVVKAGDSLVSRDLPTDAEIKKAMLAAAMTAYSTKSTVNVNKDATTWTELTLWTE